MATRIECRSGIVLKQELFDLWNVCLSERAGWLGRLRSISALGAAAGREIGFRLLAAEVAHLADEVSVGREALIVNGYSCRWLVRHVRRSTVKCAA